MSTMWTWCNFRHEAVAVQMKHAAVLNVQEQETKDPACSWDSWSQPKLNTFRPHVASYNVCHHCQTWPTSDHWSANIWPRPVCVVGNHLFWTLNQHFVFLPCLIRNPSDSSCSLCEPVTCSALKLFQLFSSWLPVLVSAVSCLCSHHAVMSHKTEI